MSSSAINLIDPLCSDKVTKKYVTTVFANSYSGMCTTLVGFPGAGKTLELSYLCKNAIILPGYSAKHLFGVMDIGLLDSDASSAYQDTLSYISANFSAELTDEFVDAIDKTMQLPRIKLSDFLKITHLGISLGYSFTFVIDSANRLLFPTKTSGVITSVLSAIRKVHTAKVTFVFLALREFDEAAVERLGSLGSVFVQNFVYGRDLLFDEQGADYMFDYHERTSSVVFNLSLRRRLIELCYGDPRLLHIFINKIKSNAKISEKILSCKSPQSVVEILGLETLNNHYKKVLQVLLPDTLEFSLSTNSIYTRIPDYLQLAGLFVRDKVKKAFVPVNPMFDYFLKTYDLGTPLSNTSEDKKYVLAQLGGQQLLVFNLIANADGGIVDRESIAKVLWGDTWESKYSDWAIDQVVARLRTKLEEMRYSKTIKTIKGKGVMLV